MFQKTFGPKNFVQKICGSKKVLGSKNLGAKKFLGSKKFVRFKTVTVEIFLIWTYVARTNVAWTNVTVTVNIC